MAIKDLQARQGQVDLIAEVTEKGDVREFEKFGKKGRVCNAKIKDATGEMSLTLWNEQIDQVKPGDKIHITNGYVNEFQGEKQLTTGRFGTLEVVEKAEGAEEEKPAEEAKKEKPKAEEKKEEKASVEEEEIK